MEFNLEEMKNFNKNFGFILDMFMPFYARDLSI